MTHRIPCVLANSVTNNGCLQLLVVFCVLYGSSATTKIPSEGRKDAGVRRDFAGVGTRVGGAGVFVRVCAVGSLISESECEKRESDTLWVPACLAAQRLDERRVASGDS